MCVCDCVNSNTWTPVSLVTMRLRGIVSIWNHRREIERRETAYRMSSSSKSRSSPTILRASSTINMVRSLREMSLRRELAQQGVEQAEGGDEDGMLKEKILSLVCWEKQPWWETKRSWGKETWSFWSDCFEQQLAEALTCGCFCKLWARKWAKRKRTSFSGKQMSVRAVTFLL